MHIKWEAFGQGETPIFEIVPELPGDGREYEILAQAAASVSSLNVPGLIAEIGVRLGGGMKVLIDTVGLDERTVIAIDPYGDIPYSVNDEIDPSSRGYDNAMRDECLANLYLYAKHTKANVLFFPLEDTEFFSRYSDGVPIYVDGAKKIEDKYALVHFDGPHSSEAVIQEVLFFDERMSPGGYFVFDDIGAYVDGTSSYDHESTVHPLLTDRGWEPVTMGKVKWSYVR